MKALWMKVKLVAAACAVTIAAGTTTGVGLQRILAQEQAASPGAPAVVILDTAGFWRMHHVLKPPVMEVGGKLQPVPLLSKGKAAKGDKRIRGPLRDLLAEETSPPPADWAQPDFDDGGWVRGTAPSGCRTPYLARLCLRGKFTVTNPARVRGLRVSVGYYGGVVVYVNGKELARQHLPAGKAEAAEAYPKEAFVAEDGKQINLRGNIVFLLKDVPQGTLRRIERRTRTLEAEIRSNLLRKGLNVVAIEIVRAPYHQVVDEQRGILKSHGEFDKPDLSWDTCEIKKVQLVAADASGLVPNATRPAGLQVWNSDALATDYDLDFGIQAEPLRPIRLVGVRNGTYSGKVVVGSDKPIRGLKVTASELKGRRGAIPASEIRIRYALPWGELPLVDRNTIDTIPYPADPSPLLALAEDPLRVFPVRQKKAGGGRKVSLYQARRYGFGPKVFLKAPAQPEPVFGAVVPVWVTVKVPKQAKPGTYAGNVAIRVSGRKLAEVPVELKVVDWMLPEVRDYRTWVDLTQLPDTLAVEYKARLWSPKHWELIARSMKCLGELGGRMLFVPLIAQTNLGNEQSMVRWIKKGENKYDYDFSVVEKYLDLAEKHMGKPQVVVFNVWDKYLTRKGSGGRAFQIKSGLRHALPGPLVTVVDPASGKTQNATLPDLTEPPSKALWKALFDQLRQRMKKRGLEETMMLGMTQDLWPTKEQVEFLKEVSGGLPWANTSHYWRKTLQDVSRFAYNAHYFHTRFGLTRSLHGWKEAELHVAFDRNPLDSMPITRVRLLTEYCITGNTRGAGRLGADTWAVPFKDRRGRERRVRVWERYPGSDWGYLSINSSFLAPGPKGPVATMRFEALREGVQECEALIALERALDDKNLKQRLGAALARRCERALDERRRCIWRSLLPMQVGPVSGAEVRNWRGMPSVAGHTWFLGSGWQARSEKLYKLAGEVQKKLGRRR